MDTPLLIAGLGNPGAQYARNRHNAGFIVADEIHAHYRFGPWKAKFEAFCRKARSAGRKTYLLKPQTYMNDSGVSVGAALRFFKLPLPALVVIHDEIDLAAGKIKVKTGGGDAGPERTALHHRARSGPIIAGCASASAIPARRSWSPPMCCRISPRKTSPG